MLNTRYTPDGREYVELPRRPHATHQPQRLTRTQKWVLGTGAVLGLAALGSLLPTTSDEEPQREAITFATAAATPTESPAEPTPLPEQCTDVPPGLLDRLELPAMQTYGGQLEVLQAAAVQGVDNWFIAARIDMGDNGEPPLAVWATASMEGSGAMLYSVDAMARAVTHYPDARDYGLSSSMPDAALEAKGCLQ